MAALVMAMGLDTAAPAEAAAEVAVGDPGAESSAESTPWIRRWAPQRMMGELGIYAGLMFPSGRLELFEPRDGPPFMGFRQFDRVAPDLGLRAGFFPIRFFGIEAEGGAIPTQVRGSDARATLWTVRGHVVGQVGLWSVTPFVLAGATALGVASDPSVVGRDVDAAIHVGLGVKAYLNRWMQLRLDFRETISAGQGVDAGVVLTPEVLLGFSVTLGRKPPQEPRPVEGPKDSDGDGFLDPDDDCPDVPGVAPDGCPIEDSDGDGFLDPDDKCPTTPGVEPDGCPVGDRDGDGFLDPDDKCPDQPETVNEHEDDDGCPDEIPKEIKEFDGVIEGIFFDLNKATIKNESQPRLDRAVESMKRHPKLRVEVIGHTDSTGGDAHNMDLSRRRAEAVKQYLVDHGVKSERVETRGAGPHEPIDSNLKPEGRAKNRRIEFRVLDR
jgi:outer membrane protein OmpA-like peptidoglycan-associated protein